MAKKKGFDRNAKGFLLGRLLPGLGIISLAVALAFLLRGLLDAEQMWQRIIGIVTVLGIGFGGFFYILVGTPGLALGFGAILILALVNGLSQPWKGLMLVALTGLMLLPGLCAKRRDAEEPDSPKIDGERIKSPEGERVLSVPGGSDTPCQTVLVLGPTSGTVYQLFASAEGLLLYRAGSEMRGVKESLLQRTDAPLREPGKGDIRVVASDVELLRFFTTEANSMKFSGHSLLRMRLRAGGRTRTFLPYISDPRGSEQAFVKALRDFLPDVCEDPEGILSSEPRPARFDRERAKRLNVALKALMVFTFAVHAPWLFLEVPQRLFSVLALLSVPIVLALCLIYPDELSLYQSARLADGRARVSLMLLGSSFVPALRVMSDFNFLDYDLLFALSLAFSCLPIGLLITRMREWKLKRSLLLAPAIALLIYSLGLTAYLNWLPDFASAPVERMEVVDMYVSERSRSPDRYILCLDAGEAGPREIDVEPDQYEATAVGGEVFLITHPGWLGIPYAEVRPVP